MSEWKEVDAAAAVEASKNGACVSYSESGETWWAFPSMTSNTKFRVEVKQTTYDGVPVGILTEAPDRGTEYWAVNVWGLVQCFRWDNAKVEQAALLQGRLYKNKKSAEKVRDLQNSKVGK